MVSTPLVFLFLEMSFIFFCILLTSLVAIMSLDFHDKYGDDFIIDVVDDAVMGSDMP